MVGRCPSGYSTVTQIIPHCEMFPVITTTLMLFYRKQIRVHTEVLELAFVIYGTSVVALIGFAHTEGGRTRSLY